MVNMVTMTRKIFLFGVFPLLLTLLSVFYIRYVPTVVGNLCGPNGNEFCYEPLPRAGFPFSYWIDVGGISVEGELGIDDDFSVLALGADFLVYASIVFILDRYIQRERVRETI